MIQLFTKKRRKGFTLIELVVVIAILGILAAIAIPRFAGTRDRAQDQADAATIRTLESAYAMYLAEVGEAAAVDWTSANNAVWGDYLNAWPTLGVAPGVAVTSVGLNDANVITVTP